MPHVARCLNHRHVSHPETPTPAMGQNQDQVESNAARPNKPVEAQPAAAISPFRLASAFGLESVLPMGR